MDHLCRCTSKKHEKLQEIENLEKIMDENQQKMVSLKEEQTDIEQEKEKIMDMMMGIQWAKKWDLLEMQIAIRKLKLEKTNLHLGNLDIKWEILVSRNEQEAKDEEMASLQDEVAHLWKAMKEQNKWIEEEKAKLW